MLKILIGILITYLLILTLSYVFQDRLIFQAKKLERDYAFQFNQPCEEHFIETPDSQRLNVLHFKTTCPCKGVVVYFHGNADNLQRWGHFAADFTKLGYDVVLADYRSYGKSTGKPTETVLYKDAQWLWDWAKSKYEYPRWVIYGRSLGAAVATHLAQDVQPDLLGLETPFETINGAWAGYLLPYKMKYRFPNKDHLGKITCKKYIFHGTSDWVVPLSSALKLKPLLKNGDEMVIIEGGGHKNLNTFPIYHQKLAELLK
jgi:uncharacterized protein